MKTSSLKLLCGSATLVYLARKVQHGLLKSEDALESEAHEVVLRHRALPGQGEFKRLRHLCVAVKLRRDLGLKGSHGCSGLYSLSGNGFRDDYYAARLAANARNRYYAARVR
jgi:hypothetical protein